MNDTIVKLKTIADMQDENIKFYIDTYQRGYRWSENQVKDLLDDIYEFSQMPNKPEDLFYCLQPVIVTKSQDGQAWKVIDGQQRLTTLYLVYIYYVSVAGKRKPLMPYELSYNDKPKLEACLSEIYSSGYSESEELDDMLAHYADDIDCFYVINAYKVICDFYKKLSENPYTQNHENAMKDIFDLHTKIIWYELVDCDLDKEVAVFSKINMGKIPLTNAELIKALLLKNDINDTEELKPIQESIAIKWDEIEAQLSDPDFWNFLVNNDQDMYSTRIDYIFRIMARELNEGVLKTANTKHPKDDSYTVSESVNKDMFSFYVFNNYVRYLVKYPDENKKDSNYVTEIWNNVCDYYRMFKDWYQNIHWYHLIGFLVEVSGEQYISQVSKLTKLYRLHTTEDSEGHKTRFEYELRKQILFALFGKNDCNYEECQETIYNLEYGKSNHTIIRNFLLLYNISYLELCNTGGRFPYAKYKNKEISWDIEHINAVADDMPMDDLHDKPDNQRLLWLNNTAFIPDDLKTVDGRKVKELIKKIIDNKLYLAKYQKGTGDFVQVYEAVIDYFGDSNSADNSIANLTLLDTGTNRSYKNYVFPVKRKIILENSMKDVFVPICTRNVFLKAYVESTNLLKWSQNDKDTYKEDIVSMIAKYLGVEVSDND